MSFLALSSVHPRHSLMAAAFALLFAAGSAQAQQPLPDDTADAVYGQGNLTLNLANRGGANPSANTLNTPNDVAVDSSGGVYVADTANNRVLFFPAGSFTATRVYGQAETFDTGIANKGGISANSLSAPASIALGPAGDLYVADTGNHRVLRYPAGSTTADRVYGQNGDFTSATPNLGGTGGAPTRTSLNSPTGVAVGAEGVLYVVDSGNNRALRFPAGSVIADQVLGQAGSFTTANAGPPGTRFSLPFGVTAEPAGGAYVADQGQHRVLRYPATSLTPNRVYGQGGSGTSAVANLGGISAEGLSGPSGLDVDSSGGLFVADRLNHRVLHYSSTSVIADRVYGQTNSFTTNAQNKGVTTGTAANVLSSPTGVAFDPATGSLYIADQVNHRVLRFDAPPAPPIAIAVFTTSPVVPVAGQPFNFAITGNNMNPATVQVEFTGPNCTPCVVGNAQLSDKTAIGLAGTATLPTAGSYTVTVRNGALGPTATPGLSITVAAAPGGGGTTITVTSITSTPAAPVAGQAFTFTINGTGFDPATAQAEFTGPGCAPCTVTNAQLTTKTANAVGGTATLATAGAYTATVRNGAGGTVSSTTAPLSVVTAGGGGTGTGTAAGTILSHIADSAGWTTTIILVNLDNVPADFALRFYGSETTGRAASAPLDLAFQGRSGRAALIEGTIPVGGSRTFVTAGTDANLNMGWAELTTTRKISGFGVFRDVVGRQEAAVGLTPPVPAFLLPFDNTAGRVTSFAVISRNSTAPITVQTRVRSEDGTVLSSGTVSLAVRGHKAQVTPDLFPATAGQRGVIEFRTTGADITGLGFRFDAAPTTPGAAQAFTSFAVHPVD